MYPRANLTEILRIPRAVSPKVPMHVTTRCGAIKTTCRGNRSRRPVDGGYVCRPGVLDVQTVHFPPRPPLVVPTRHPPEAPEDVRRV